MTLPILGKEQIIIGYDILDRIVLDTLRELPSSTYVLITDTNIAKHDHVQQLISKIETKISSENQRLLVLVIPPGELTKSRTTKAKIEDFMFAHKCTRDSVVLAVGGGVIGDMIGYVAATFMRGVKYVQIPTTLLAMVDSSIGGKTAIDVPSGKNLVGAFWQPSLNFIELRFLETLPRREFLNGMAEVVKTAAIWNAEEFDRLERVNPAFMAAMAAPRDAKGRANLSSIKQDLLDTVHGSVKVKAEVVTLDEREGGLRNILNFGHSIGHAYEALLTPHILHGECVSIGSVLEAELSRFYGYLSPAAVARLVSCFKAYELPVTVTDPIVRQRSRNAPLPVNKLLEIMAVDKKNSGKQKRIVLLDCIGKTHEPNASVVPDEIIRIILSNNIAVSHQQPDSMNVSNTVIPPGSKSISNRVLVLCALAKGTCRISNLLHSDDTGYMLDALQKLDAASIELANNGDTLVITGGRKMKSPSSELYLGNAGTAARFLTAVAALVPGKVHLTGNQRMQERPVGALVDALRNNGIPIEYCNHKGSLPLDVEGDSSGQIKGGRIELAATVSSQYVSALLMVAPYAQNPVTLSLVGGKPVSQFYIDMTIQMMADFGLKVEKSTIEPHTYHIPQGIYKSPAEYVIESDASSATYPLAYAALTGTECTVPTIGSASLQGDARFATDVLERMGCEVHQTATSTTVRGPPMGQSLRAIDVDMEPMTDAFLTACVVAAVAEGTTRITGIANQHVKECDRIKAMHDQLAKFGVKCVEGSDGIDVTGVPVSNLKTPSSTLHSYDDHRVAMSLSLLASRVPGMIVIDDRRCVEKTWPGWWDTLYSKLGVNLEGRFQAPNLSKPKPSSVASNHSIVLVGMRGAGKTSLGMAAASALGMKFADIDHELERELGVSIRELINEKGWAEFREKEAAYLAKFLSAHSNGHVIACGGGIVETEYSRSVLKSFAKQGLVVHVHRNLEAIIKMLEQDVTRPRFDESIEAVYRRREPLYAAVANRIYWQPSVVDHSQLRSSLASFFASQSQLDVTRRSFFLSLTFSNLMKLPENVKISEIVEGCEAVELRVDLLESWAPEFVAEQLSTLRLLTDLPIIFTVRTKSQGGQFPNDSNVKYEELIKLAFMLNVEYVDVELTATHSHPLVSSLRNTTKTRVIASHHDPKGEWDWTGMKWHAAFFDANRLGDIVKFVGYAHHFEDNFKLEEFRKEISASHTPFIGINMGPRGRASRVLNSVFTPVTHKNLLVAAAPGQMSVAECNSMLAQLGGLEPLQFFVTGKPIGHSQSPKIHNSGYTALGLPHSYFKFETDDVDTLKSYIATLGKKFGGASVTIPLKEKVISICSETSDEVKIIGAVNTLTPLSDGSGILGSNTDWIGIKDSFRKKGVLTGSSALIVGAGGTALAAVYAFHKMGYQHVYVLNRTHSKAVAISKRFEALVKVIPVDDSVEVKNVNAVLSCVPGDTELPSEILSRLKKALSKNSGVLLEAAYKPAITPIMELASSCNWATIPGLQMLVYQGVEQFYRWTQFRPSETAEKAVV